MNSNASGDPNQPLASKVPLATSVPPYYYQFTFLPPGTYTVAFTCEAAQDIPDQANPSVVILTPVATTAGTAGQTATVGIALGSMQGRSTKTLPPGCTPGVDLYRGTPPHPQAWH